MHGPLMNDHRTINRREIDLPMGNHRIHNHGVIRTVRIHISKVGRIRIVAIIIHINRAIKTPMVGSRIHRWVKIPIASRAIKILIIHQPYPQGNFNAYGSQSYPQGNSNVYGQQSNLQGEPISYNQPSYIQTPVKVRSKMPFIIAGALIVILFLGGLAIGLISSNKSGTQANKNSQNAEQGDSSKILVQNGDFDTVVTVKSKDIDNIKLFKEPGGKKKAGKVQEGVPCALLQEKTVDGEKWAKIDFCNRQGWCRMDRLRTIFGETCYFYVKENSNENTVFVNERAIKLHTGAGQDTDIAATDVKYGTELTISKVEDGWGRTNYQNKECWIDMNVVGFYTSKYWQVERCDGSKNGIKLRKSSTEDSEQLTTVPLCTEFQSSDCRNGWARFTYGGKTGWLKLHYATPCGSSKGLSFSEDENNF